jgi:hypothetical protein
MPRPKTKSELLNVAKAQFENLFNLIDSMPKSNQEAPFCFDIDKAGNSAHWKRDKNIRDVLTHLYEWHRLLLIWVNANQRGENKAFLPPPYNWKTYGQMNIEFWKKHQNTSYPKSQKLLRKSHDDAIAMIKTFSNDELFVEGCLAWTGSSLLGGYCISATSSHYDWAIKKIKKQIKALKK